MATCGAVAVALSADDEVFSDSLSIRFRGEKKKEFEFKISYLLSGFKDLKSPFGVAVVVCTFLM